MTVFGCEVTAPQGSKEESQAQNNVIEKTAEYIVSREVPVVGEVLLAIDLAKPILDLPNNK